jgi:DNA-binding MarR family transcriptional regulator
MGLIRWADPPYAPPMASAPEAIAAPTASRHHDNVARHLSGISQDLQARVRHCLSEDCGYHGLRPSFGPFLSLLWNEGRPLSALASELAISPQACSQLANRVEEAGYLRRTPHPEDRRSKLVELTPRGRRLVEEGVRIILETESEYSALVGAGAYRRFTAALADLYRGLALPTRPDPSLPAEASRSVGVVPLLAVRAQRMLMEATIARGHPGLKMSAGEVLPLVGPEGRRIHQLASVQGVSRQAISAVAKELEEAGYLRRQPDPRDRRGVVLHLTRRGEELIADSLAAQEELEASFRKLLGEERLAQLKHTARDLYRALHPGSEQPAPGTRQRVPNAAGGHIEQLATRLQRQLGSRDAARLAALLEPGPGVGRTP